MLHLNCFLLLQTNQPNLEVSNLLQNTEYKIRVRAKTSAGFGPYSALNTVRTRPTSQLLSSDQQPPLSVILVIILLCLLLLGCGIVITFRYRKTGKLLCLRTTRRKKKEQDELLNGIPLQEPLLQERLIGTFLFFVLFCVYNFEIYKQKAISTPLKDLFRHFFFRVSMVQHFLLLCTFTRSNELGDNNNNKSITRATAK